jgi:hypothetical protein
MNIYTYIYISYSRFIIYLQLFHYVGHIIVFNIELMNMYIYISDFQGSLYSFSNFMRWAGHAARMGERRNAYRILVGKPDGKRPLGRPRCRWVDNIKMDLKEVGWDGRDWIDLAQDRDRQRAYVNAVMNLRVP